MADKKIKEIKEQVSKILGIKDYNGTDPHTQLFVSNYLMTHDKLIEGIDYYLSILYSKEMPIVEAMANLSVLITFYGGNASNIASARIKGEVVPNWDPNYYVNTNQKGLSARYNTPKNDH